MPSPIANRDTYAALEARIRDECAILADLAWDRECARRNRADAYALDEMTREIGRQRLVVERLEALLAVAA